MDGIGLRQFIETAALQLIFNKFQGAPGVKRRLREISANPLQDDEANQERQKAPPVCHMLAKLVRLDAYLGKDRAQRRCSECSGRSSFYCLTCYEKDEKVTTVCNPTVCQRSECLITHTVNYTQQ